MLLTEQDYLHALNEAFKTLRKRFLYVILFSSVVLGSIFGLVLYTYPPTTNEYLSYSFIWDGIKIQRNLHKSYDNVSFTITYSDSVIQKYIFDITYDPSTPHMDGYLLSRNATPLLYGKLGEAFINAWGNWTPKNGWVEHPWMSGFAIEGLISLAEYMKDPRPLVYALALCDFAELSMLNGRFFSSDQHAWIYTPDLGRTASGIMEAYKLTGYMGYFECVRDYFRLMSKWNRAPNGAIYYSNISYSEEARFQIIPDYVFMYLAPLAQYAQLTNNETIYDDVVTMVLGYIEYLKADNGLYYSSFNVSSGLPDAMLGWSRGNGWVLAGFGEILSCLPSTHENYTRISSEFQALARVLSSCLDNYTLHYEVQNVTSNIDSSGMILYAYGLKLGIYELQALDKSVFNNNMKLTFLNVENNYFYVDGTLTHVSHDRCDIYFSSPPKYSFALYLLMRVKNEIAQTECSG